MVFQKGTFSNRVFGHIPGFYVGDYFNSRKDLSISGLHRPTQAGISGSHTEGADSIVLSGGYEDDQDFGDIIIYTGHGGNDPETGKQIHHQTLERGNLALALNKLYGLPVRVIRKVNRETGQNSFNSPSSVYRYDGLYRVEDYWHEVGKSGFTIWRFRLVKVQEEAVEEPPKNLLVAESKVPYNVNPEPEASPENNSPERTETYILRIVRDTSLARQVKELYDYTCQVCGERLVGTAGPYAEAAHIKPLGAPHNGPDSLDNLLCLCPNHHVLFDFGGFGIRDDYLLINHPGRLKVHPKHQINPEYLRYHREHYQP